MFETTLSSHHSKLSPAKRDLLEKRLRRGLAAVSENRVIPRVSNRVNAPLSYAQQRLWFLAQLEPNSVAYNVPIAFRLRGRLDPAALQQSLDHLVARHESLRTTFRFESEGPVQVVHPPSQVPLPLTDLSNLPSDVREQQALAHIHESMLEPFDLIQGPVLRASLLRLADEEHIALLVLHHIVSDAWSMGVLVKEVAELYLAYSTGEQPALPELEVQYVDYAVWQREWLQGEVYDKQLAYWRDRLAGIPPVLELPADRPRPAVQSFRGSVHRFELNPQLTEKLRALSQAEGATLFMGLLAGFKVLLSRYTSQKDVVVGTPIANRGQQEIEDLVGFFANAIVLRTDLSGAPDFREAIRRERDVCLGAYTHQDLPFEKLVEELQPERDPSYPPLFQVVFVLQNAGTTALQLPGLVLERMEFETGTAKVDLTVELTEAANILNGSIEYNSDLFEPETIERLVGHYTTLLEAAVANPDRLIKDLPLLTAPELEQLTVEWNNTKATYADNSCLHDLFEARVEQTPEATAVVYEDQELSYAELNRRANQLAHLLRARGVGPETVAGICLERSPEMIIALLATLKAGAAYLPLDPTYPIQRLRYMIDDARCRLVLTQQSLAASVATEVEVLCLDVLREEISAQSVENVSSGVTPENLAYIIYTSGSTGKPKGVMVRHRGGCNLTAAQIKCFDLRPDNRVLQFASLSFDASFFEIVMALLVGARLYLAKRDDIAPGPDLARLLQQHEITNVTLPPSSLALLPREDFPDLRTIITAGEAVSSDLVAQWSEGRRFFNAYGPTETTVWATVAECRNDGRKPLIGWPISNMQVYLLDEYLNPVPAGVKGELHIGGVGLARGYLDQPDLTAARFIPNPFGSQAGARLYKTGDLARYRRNGAIEFLGRIDHQVKIRGFRIELGEIQEILDQHPEIVESAVIDREDTPGDKRLVAYIVVEPGAAPSVSSLREFLKDKLPEYMLPAAFITLDKLPVTTSGKVDRSVLPAPEPERPVLDQAFAAPRNPTEEILAGMWAKILGVENVGVDDNFFELGGHSLLAKQVTSRARDTFHVELPLRSLFKTPTVAGVAKEIDALIREDQEDLLPPLTQASRDGIIPLSYAQQRLWFLSQLEPGSAAYNVPIALRLRGRLDVDALQRSLDYLVARHESLRTTFGYDGGTPIQIVNEPHSVPLQRSDLSDLPASVREQQCLLLAKQYAREPFDLTSGPVLRAHLFRLHDEQHIALLVLHHIVSDAWSMGVLVKEVATLYTAFADADEPELEELSIQYADYAVWQREWLEGEVYEQQLDYWREQLAGSPPVLELPADRPRPALQTYHGGIHRFELSRELAAELKSLSQVEGATLFMVLLAAFKVLLSRYTGQQDIVIGTPVANRNQEEIESLIGFFVNTLVLRTDLSGGPSFREAVRREREVCLGAYTHQDLPFEKLVEELQPQRDLSHTPLFQVMFSLQNVPIGRLELPGLGVDPLELDSETVKFDLTLGFTEVGTGLAGAFEYNTDLFEAATIAEMATQLTTLLRAAVAEPDVAVTRLPLLTATERRRVLQQPNQTAQEYPATLIHELIEAQAVLNGELPALQFEGETLSYAELNRRANQLAHHLRGRGVGPETVVGLCLERSLELVISIVATLKAGGAYMPLDPSYPQERLRYMVANAGCQVVLTKAELEEQAEAIAGERETNPVSGVTEANSAYLIYTSGSTGQPKGVVNTHGGLRNRLQWMQQQYGLSSTDAVLQKTPFSFDVSVWEFLWPLMMGARLVVARPGGHQDSSYLVELIRKQNVTVMHFVPSMLRVFLQEAEAHTCASLRLVVCSGEALPAELVWEFYGRLNETKLENLYGPTEAAIDVSYWSCPREGELLSVPIGRPIANTELYVLDEQLEPVPVGVSGEIYIGGVGLARGYVSQPGLTAERFIPHPFAGGGARLYRTGDVGRWNRQGELEYLGRGDTQVKVRGFRIELGEIEAAVARQPEVAECVVEVRAGRGGDQRLVCYLVLAAGAQLQVSGLREQLREQLPEYMVPGVFVELAELPLSAHGKLDRKRLPEPEGERPELALAYEEPRSELEREIAQVWAEVLGVQRVGAYDNFFDLGGHSLLLVEAQRKLVERGVGAVSVVEMFQYPTVNTLARRIQNERGSAESVDRGQGRAEARRQMMKRRSQSA